MHSPTRVAEAISLQLRHIVAYAAVASIAVTAFCSTSTAQPTAPVQIRVASTESINAGTPMFVASRQGFFKDAGLDVTYVTVSGGAAPLAAALRAGEVDIALGGAIQFMDFIARGLVPGKLIGQFTDNNYIILGGSGISDIRQLRGKIFGISSPNAGDHLYSKAVLAQFGIGSEDVTWLSMGAVPARVAALVAGKIDALNLAETSLLESDKARIILRGEDSPVPFVSAAIFARQGFLDSNRPALMRFLAAIGRGAVWARSNHADAIAACQSTISTAAVCKITAEVASASKNPYTWSPTTWVNVQAVRGMVQFLPEDLPAAKTMKIEDFVDASLAAAP